VPRPGVIFPLLLIFFAVFAAAAVAYGTDPAWAHLDHGLQMIVWSRRLQWPMVTLSIVLCVALMALAISGRRRVWWMIGLTPVMALFVHWFQASRPHNGAVVENPRFVEASHPSVAMGDGDWVVSVSFGDTTFAYPYAALFRSPVVLQSDHENWMVLLWSAYANRVLAFQSTHELKARDLELVSMPANAPLLYNGRLGQFVNAFTGQTLDGQRPASFGKPIRADKMTWRQWRDAYPNGKVWWPVRAPDGPKQPIAPAFAAKGIQPVNRSAEALAAGAAPAPVRRRVVVIGTTHPAAVLTDQLGPNPLNLKADGEPFFVFRRDPSAPAQAFSGHFAEGIYSKFESKRDPKHPDAMFKDVDTETLWSAAGVGVGGNREYRGKHLTSIPVDDGVDWEVLKYWYPEVEIYREPPKPPPPPVVAPPAATHKAKRPTTRPSRKPRPPASASHGAE
jgi:hypothetical protein